MKKMIGKFYCVIALTVMVIPAASSATLVPYSAQYKIKISILSGKLETRMELADNGFSAESVIQPTGLARIVASGEIREKSWFTEVNESIRPIRYVSNDELSKDGTEVDLEFDWGNHLVVGTIGGGDFQTDIDGQQLHDRVSLQYALMYDMLQGRSHDSYKLQDAEELKHLSVTNLGVKEIKVPFGSYDSVGLQHRAGNSSRVTTLWLAEELNYLPVLIEQHRKGKLQVRAELTDYEADDGDSAL